MYQLEQLEDAETGERFTMLRNGDDLMAETEIVDALMQLRAHDPDGYEYVANLIAHLLERAAPVDGIEA